MVLAGVNAFAPARQGGQISQAIALTAQLGIGIGQVEPEQGRQRCLVGHFGHLVDQVLNAIAAMERSQHRFFIPGIGGAHQFADPLAVVVGGAV